MAVEKIKMPQLGESVTEGSISKWLVSIGDKINKYAPLAEVMTDKVNAEIPSSFTGVVKELLAEEGDTLAVGEIICTIETDIESDSNSLDKKTLKIERITSEIQQNKGRYSPAVLKIAHQHNIDLSKVHGTGAAGRITRKDLLGLLDANDDPKTSHPPLQAIEQWPVNPEQVENFQVPNSVNFVRKPADGDIEIPVTGVRKAIAAHMHRSKHEIPHAWTMIEADVTNLVEYRNRIKADFLNNEGFNLTFFAFFVKAAAQALKEFTQINSVWAEDKILLKKDINISIAVAAEDALYVPVIKKADEKSIKGIARDISELAQKARSGKLTAQDLSGGSFTINNTGTFGSVQSMGIINHPQAAILQVESIVKRPVVINNNMIAIRDMVNLCMSLDHRILDGLICGRFLQRIKEILEQTSESTAPIY
jgi:2-oxoisovalerate dehydrogenase E2 component (dihydrolipoyl transacylase)